MIAYRKKDNTDILQSKLHLKDAQIKYEQKKYADLMTAFSCLSAQIKDKDDWIEQANKVLNAYRKDNDDLSTLFNTEHKKFSHIAMLNFQLNLKHKKILITEQQSILEIYKTPMLTCIKK